MMDMMQTCWNWMMGLGVVGMLAGIVILALIVTLLIVLIRRFS